MSLSVTAHCLPAHWLLLHDGFLLTVVLWLLCFVLQEDDTPEFDWHKYEHDAKQVSGCCQAGCGGWLKHCQPPAPLPPHALLSLLANRAHQQAALCLPLSTHLLASPPHHHQHTHTTQQEAKEIAKEHKHDKPYSSSYESYEEKEYGYETKGYEGPYGGDKESYYHAYEHAPQQYNYNNDKYLAHMYNQMVGA